MRGRRERPPNQGVVLLDLNEVRLQWVPRAGPGVADELARVVGSKLANRNATACGKHAKPLPLRALGHGSGRWRGVRELISFAAAGHFEAPRIGYS